MANSVAKMLGILSYMRDGEFITFSAAHVYKRRINKPNQGMYLYDALGIAANGVTLEALVKSEQKTDIEIDQIIIEPHEERVGKVFAANEMPVYIKQGDFDSVASVVKRTGYGVLCMFYFTENEWGQFIPVAEDPRLTSDKALRHGVVAIDAFKYNGNDVLLIEDSAHFGGYERRLVTRTFFNKRNIANGYLMGFKFDKGKGDRPVFEDTNISLQRCLQYEGLFPLNISFVENYGPVTKNAVIAFQKKYGIEPSVGILGTRTLEKLRELYPKK